VLKKSGYFYFMISLISLIAFFLFWYVTTAVFEIIPPNVLPNPLKVFQTLIWKLTHSNPDGATLLQHLAASLQVALSGYLIGLIVGIPLGVFMAWSEKFDWFVRPLFDIIRPIPGIAWIPVMITLFGIGLLSKAMVIFLSSFTANLVHSYSGIKQTKAVHLWVGKAFGASNRQLLFRIAIPSSLPLMLTGMRVALASSWGALIAAELLASTRGLGFMIQAARGLLRPDIIIAGMIVIGLVGAFITYILALLEKLLIKGGRW
jgi:NitT/TauT family transport system permease protein/taurine transport system permease protein